MLSKILTDYERNYFKKSRPLIVRQKEDKTVQIHFSGASLSL
jgi:hypothetical protein